MIKAIKLFLVLLSLISLNATAIEKYFPNLKADFSENIDKYCIEKNDSLVALAAKCKVSPSFILYLNPELHSYENFYPGKVIKLPGLNVKSFIGSKSRSLTYLIDQLGAEDFQTRNNALNQLIDSDWKAVPILMKALKCKEVEIRGNAKEALKQIFRTCKKLEKLEL
ncbi:MAG: LysM peptidoglycan-binding domain-containing protein [Lentisphaerales bacterium]|nr:LysM peptidoglycan-binding domain-containing protein [Lentisphaerales bacterium]